ncbi:MAG: alpha-L-rhamnosidase N-terminal domain-containing protein [Sedimentisphaerales bacterium]|nr:alpha-L-rhamnosidase N-terminal domain-containing protein [Sedimentisphaerales bacterium]
MRRFFRISIAAIIWGLLSFSGLAAQQPWQAEWIGLSQSVKPNSWLCYRTHIHVEKIPQNAVASIACDSKYWLWINGQMAVFEGQLKRGPSPENTYYDEVDLTKYLKAGDNTIAVLVWYWGKHGFSHNNSGRAGLVFDLTVDGKRFASGSDWKIRLHPAYGQTEPPHPNYRLPEGNVQFDARQDLGEWQGTDYDDSAWSKAALFGKPPVAPWNVLEKRPLLQWKNSGLVEYVNVKEQAGKDGQRLFVGTLPYNAQVTPYLKVKAPAGKSIEIKTDDYVVSGVPGVRAVYITKEGVQEYESLGWMNGHDVRYSVPEGVEVLALKYRETGYNAEFAGSFNCDDKALNTLWEKARRTLYITMRDTYMDCPDRERAQWIGDAVNEIGEAFYVFDAVYGPQLARKCIQELVRWQRKDNVFYSPSPAGIPIPGGPSEDGSWDKELPMQSLACAGWYGIWTYYWYTGDKQTIADIYPQVKDYLNLWKFDNNGLVIHRGGEWDWVDWGTNIDVAVIENAWFYLAMKAAIEMAQLTDHDPDVTEYQKKMEWIASHYNKTFWQGDCYRTPGYQGKTDDRAQAMAVVAGLAESGYYPAIQKVLKTEYHASPYMEKYVLEALCLMNAPELALERMKLRYDKQIASELSTLWEGWETEGGSYNHGWSGGPLTILSQHMAGISPLKAGFAEVSIMPQMGNLREITSVASLPQGHIDLKLQQSENRFQINLKTPVRAMVCIPKCGKVISIVNVNDTAVYKDKKNMVGESGKIEFAGEDEHWICFAVETGEWKISADIIQ